jgi:putative hemolysin
VVAHVVAEDRRVTGVAVRARWDSAEVPAFLYRSALPQVRAIRGGELIMRPLMMLAILVVVLGTAGGCTDDTDGQEMPNPAAVFCEERGGTVSGAEPMCTLPDGTVVDAWEYYRAENASSENA